MASGRDDREGGSGERAERERRDDEQDDEVGADGGSAPGADGRRGGGQSAQGLIVCDPNDGSNRCDGGRGDGFIAGSEERDEIYASGGRDLVFANDGDDLVNGQDGNDCGVDGSASGLREEERRVADCNRTNDNGFGEDAGGGLFGEGGDDNIDGGPGNDDLNDDFQGLDEDDLMGEGGDDVLNAADGDHDDTLDCGKGRDIAIFDEGDEVRRNCGTRFTLFQNGPLSQEGGKVYKAVG